MLIITVTIVRRAKRINSDIQTIDTLSDDPADWSPTDGSPGDELAATVLVTVVVTDCTSVLVLVVMAVDITVDVVVSVTAQVPVRVNLNVLSDNIVKDAIMYIHHTYDVDVHV